MRKYCTIIGLLLVVVLPVCAQNWTPQDSLRLRRLLDGEGEIKLNPEVLKDLTEWHDSLEDRKNHEEEHLEDYVREHKRKGRVFRHIHINHGPDLETCKECIECGFTSVMFDGSHYDYEENVAKTKEVVEYAHARGVVVEAELGKLAGVEDDVKVDAANATYTDPDQAVDFVKRTGVDSLAIAIGTSHGAYKFKGEAKLDFDRLETITKKLEDAGFHNFPIVLHGASSVDQRCVAMCNEFGGKIDGAKGIPAEMLRKASSMAVCKINMDTDLRLAMTAAIRKSFGENPAAFDPRGYLGDARNLIQELVEDKIKNVIGSVDSMK